MLICRKLGLKVDKLKIDICPLCGGQSLKHALTCTDYYASGEEFEVVRCAHCGFMMTQQAPVESEIGSYYETPDYISHSDTRRGIMNQLYHAVRRYMLSRKAVLVERATRMKQGNLLDYGTGTGYFPHTMVGRGWHAKAIEKNAKAREFAHDHFSLEVEAEDALATYPDASFDVITLWHVMEHLEHLNEMWQSLSRLLKDRGVLVVAVPNPASKDAEMYREMWAAYDVPRHLWHFTPTTMTEFGSKHGFVLQEEHPMPFDAFYVSMLSEKYKKSRMPFLKGIWAGVIAWLSALRNKERSSSMIYVFRKK